MLYMVARKLFYGCQGILDCGVAQSLLVASALLGACWGVLDDNQGYNKVLHKYLTLNIDS